MSHRHSSPKKSKERVYDVADLHVNKTDTMIANVKAFQGHRVKLVKFVKDETKTPDCFSPTKATSEPRNQVLVQVRLIFTPHRVVESANVSMADRATYM
jgi:hypothetical protein